MVLDSSPEELRRALAGLEIAEVARRGKYLIFRLSDGRSLLLHMRMTGSLLLTEREGTGPEDRRYVTASFQLDDGRELLFTDRRKLGTVALVHSEAELERKQGPEPLDESFTVEALSAILSRRSAPVKAVLCDQGAIAGIGNMYADEALFLAGLHPLRAANSLSPGETARLRDAIQEVLRKGIRNAGATFSDYRRPDGSSGQQQDHFAVAHRGGQTCKVCAAPLERIVVRNRGTYYCPGCQSDSTCSGSSASSSL